MAPAELCLIIGVEPSTCTVIGVGPESFCLLCDIAPAAGVELILTACPSTGGLDGLPSDDIPAGTGVAVELSMLARSVVSVAVLARELPRVLNVNVGMELSCARRGVGGPCI